MKLVLVDDNGHILDTIPNVQHKVVQHQSKGLTAGVWYGLTPDFRKEILETLMRYKGIIDEAQNKTSAQQKSSTVVVPFRRRDEQATK